MTDELDTILAESLRTRASLAGTDGRGFGDVRRRVRRHRQRQMAAGLLPAVAGFGWIVTRPVADDPLRPGADATNCGDTLPASTQPGLAGDATSTTSAPRPWTGESTTLPQAILSSSTVPGEVVIVGDVTDNTAANTTTTVYFGGVDSTVQVDDNGNVVESDVSSTTIECDDTPTLPPSTGPSEAGGDSTTTTSTIAAFEDTSFVLLVNASTVNGAARAYAARYFHRSESVSASTQVSTSYVMTLPETEGAARSIATQLGIADVRVGIDASVISGQWDRTAIQVVVVIGQNHAVSLTSPTTTSIG